MMSTLQLPDLILRPAQHKRPGLAFHPTLRRVLRQAQGPEFNRVGQAEGTPPNRSIEATHRLRLGLHEKQFPQPFFRLEFQAENQ